MSFQQQQQQQAFSNNKSLGILYLLNLMMASLQRSPTQLKIIMNKIFMNGFSTQTDIRSSSLNTMVQQLQKNQEISKQETINSQQKWLDTLISKRYNPNNKKYLILENLTQNSQNLRILDLKLGYSVEKQSHIQRYQDSTSSKVGLRICGMKIQENNELVLFKDKHWGRTISVQELIESLKTFWFKNRNQILKEAIEKIESLKQFIISHCKQVTSWQGTSLLLIYRDDNDFKIKLIDFSNTKVDLESTQINTEIIKALNSLQDIIKQI